MPPILHRSGAHFKARHLADPHGEVGGAKIKDTTPPSGAGGVQKKDTTPWKPRDPWYLGCKGENSSPPDRTLYISTYYRETYRFEIYFNSVFKRSFAVRCLCLDQIELDP